MPTFSGGDFDIIDEAIYYFKANVFFKNYEIKVSEIEIYGLGHGPGVMEVQLTCYLVLLSVDSKTR